VAVSQGGCSLQARLLVQATAVVIHSISQCVVESRQEGDKCIDTLQHHLLVMNLVWLPGVRISSAKVLPVAGQMVVSAGRRKAGSVRETQRNHHMTTRP